MVALQFPRMARLTGWLSSGVVLLGTVGLPMTAAWAQTDTNGNEAPAQVRPATAAGELSIAEGDRLMEAARAEIAAQNYVGAITTLQDARRLYNQLSTYYQELAAMFIGIDSRQASSNRSLALQTAQKRDQASYQLALLYRTQGRPEEAIPLLMEILRSQQPTRELGQQAYQQLYELGFVESPFERNGEG